MSDDPPPNPWRPHLLGHIASLSVDYRSGRAAIVGTDGRTTTALISPPDDHGLVTGSTFIPAESRMEIRANRETFTCK